MGDDLGGLPDHLGEIAVLARAAVDLEADPPALGMADRARRDQRRAGRGAVEGLGDLPRPARLLGLVLAVAPGHVEPDGVAEDVLERALDRDVAAALGERHHQLELEMDVLGAGRVGEGAAARDQSVGGLHEEERRLAVGVVAHLAGVLGVVAADAEDAVHREQIARVADRQRDDRRRRDDVGQGVLLVGWRWAAGVQLRAPA